MVFNILANHSMSVVWPTNRQKLAAFLTQVMNSTIYFYCEQIIGKKNK